MSSIYRPSTPQDEGQIIQLLSRAFSARPTAHFIQPEFVRWKFWEPCTDWPEPRSWVIERDQRIVAHASLWPVTVGVGENALRGNSMLDWAADPGTAGVGVSILMRMMKTGMFNFSVGGSPMTQTILPKIGFSVVAEAVSCSRPLRPLKRLLRNPSLDPKVAIQTARRVWWAQIPSRSVSPQWTIVEVSVDSWEPAVPSFERGKGFFDYLDRCPIARCFGFHILNKGRKVGWFALFAGQLQARLAGMWLEDPTAENWRIALNLAQTAALDRTCALDFEARSTSAEFAAGAAQAGMHVERRKPVFLRTNTGIEPPPLQYQLCDNDDVFLNIM